MRGCPDAALVPSGRPMYNSRMEIDDGQLVVLRAIAISDDEREPVAFSRLGALTGLEPDLLTSAVDHLSANAFIEYRGAPAMPTDDVTPEEAGGFVLLSAGRVLLGIADAGPWIETEG
jgi:hypothetical protein